MLVLLVPSLARAAEPIRLWHAYRGEEEAALVLALETFEGAPVELLAVPYDAFGSKLAAAIPLGDGPHLYIDTHERLGDYRRRAIVAPVGDALEPGAYEPFALKAVTDGDDSWAVPLSLKCVALFVNEDLVDIAPADLEGIAALAGTLPAGVWPLAYEAQNPYGHAPLLHAFGGRMLGDDDAFGMVGPEAEASLRFVVDLLERGVVPPDADGALVTNLFRSGKAAFAISGPWLAADLGDTVRYRVMPLPQVKAAGAPLRPFLTVESIMLSPHGTTCGRSLGTSAARRRPASARSARAR
jgi:arabinogalactan oligomer/maltooligosaccharide transport system permease protein